MDFMDIRVHKLLEQMKPENGVKNPQVDKKEKKKKVDRDDPYFGQVLYRVIQEEKKKKERDEEER